MLALKYRDAAEANGDFIGMNKLVILFSVTGRLLTSLMYIVQRRNLTWNSPEVQAVFQVDILEEGGKKKRKKKVGGSISSQFRSFLLLSCNASLIEVSFQKL